MPKPYLKCFRKNCKSNRGFTLIEMMVVMVIVGILAIGVVFMFVDPTAKVKAAAFEMRGESIYMTGGAIPMESDAEVSQGYLENANVNIMDEMVKMMEVSREFQSNQRVLSVLNETLQKTVNEIGRN